jgi:hypothetical protein
MANFVCFGWQKAWTPKNGTTFIQADNGPLFSFLFRDFPIDEAILQFTFSGAAQGVVGVTIFPLFHPQTILVAGGD